MLRLAALAVALSAGPAFGWTLPNVPPAPLVTKTYDLKRTIGQKPVAGDGPDVSGAEAVARMIFDAADIGEVKPGGDGTRVVVVDDARLEVRATAKVHEEVSDLLDALIRLNELAVDLKVDVVEFDRAAFEKDVKPLFEPAKGKADPPAVVSFGKPPADRAAGNNTRPAVAVLDGIVKGGRVVQSSARRYGNGAEAVAAARRQAFVQSQPGKTIGLEGFRLHAVPVVSADGKTVRLKLTEQTAEVTGERVREAGEIGGKPVVLRGAIVEESGRTGTVEVVDGGATLFRLGYAPTGKVWLVALRPTVIAPADAGK